MPPFSLSHTHKHIHTHTHIDTHIDTHIHTHTHTHKLTDHVLMSPALFACFFLWRMCVSACVRGRYCVPVCSIYADKEFEILQIESKTWKMFLGGLPRAWKFDFHQAMKIMPENAYALYSLQSYIYRYFIQTPVFSYLIWRQVQNVITKLRLI